MPAQLGWTQRTHESESLLDGIIDQEDICSLISLLDKLPLYKRSTESKEEHPQDQADVSQQKGFLERSNLSQIVLERKTCHGHRDYHGYYEVIKASIMDTQPKRSVWLSIKKDGSTYGWLGWSDKPIGIDPLDKIVIDSSVLGKFGSQVWKERKVGILDRNLPCAPGTPDGYIQLSPLLY